MRVERNRRVGWAHDKTRLGLDSSGKREFETRSNEEIEAEGRKNRIQDIVTLSPLQTFHSSHFITPIDNSAPVISCDANRNEEGEIDRRVGKFSCVQKRGEREREGKREGGREKGTSG